MKPLPNPDYTVGFRKAAVAQRDDGTRCTVFMDNEIQRSNGVWQAQKKEEPRGTRYFRWEVCLPLLSKMLIV